MSKTRTKICDLMLWTWKAAVSPWLGNNCRFQEKCSEYSARMISERGLITGSCFAAKRLLSCNGFNKNC